MVCGCRSACRSPLGSSYITDNALFGLLVLITTFVIFVRHAFEPSRIECEITENGIRVGSKAYPFESINSFWVLELEDGRDMLYIEEKRGLRSILPVPILEADTEHLRKILRKYIEEEKERSFEPFWEWVAHRLKL